MTTPERLRPRPGPSHGSREPKSLHQLSSPYGRVSSTPKDRANGTPNSKGKFGQLDLALQVYFQLHPEKRVHQTLFERESPGIYFFGLKKVIMKLENNQILVRVGGGYMAIDEFINQFGPGEADKMQREESQNRKSQAKI